MYTANLNRLEGPATLNCWKLKDVPRCPCKRCDSVARRYGTGPGADRAVWPWGGTHWVLGMWLGTLYPSVSSLCPPITLMSLCAPTWQVRKLMLRGPAAVEAESGFALSSPSRKPSVLCYSPCLILPTTEQGCQDNHMRWHVQNTQRSSRRAVSWHVDNLVRRSLVS